MVSLIKIRLRKINSKLWMPLFTSVCRSKPFQMLNTLHTVFSIDNVTGLFHCFLLFFPIVFFFCLLLLFPSFSLMFPCFLSLFSDNHAYWKLVQGVTLLSTFLGASLTTSLRAAVNHRCQSEGAGLMTKLEPATRGDRDFWASFLRSCHVIHLYIMDVWMYYWKCLPDRKMVLIHSSKNSLPGAYT